MENLCDICNKQSEAEVCDDCVERFCKEKDKGCCTYCLEWSCVEASQWVLCPICKREVPEDKWEKHHLVPKSKGGVETLKVCVSCGKVFHQLFSIKELETKYNTLERLLANSKIKKWIKFAHKKPLDFTICMKEKKRK